jgi:hypothetical protein
MVEKSPKRSGTSSLVGGLKGQVTEDEVDESPKVERLDERGLRRQTLYLPPAVYEQIRDQTIHDRISQQEFFRRVFDFYFRRHGMKGWDELEGKKK